MKNILAAIFLASTAAIPLLAGEAKEPLIVESPASWKITFQRSTNGEPMYNVFSMDGDKVTRSGFVYLYRPMLFENRYLYDDVKKIPELIEKKVKSTLENIDKDKLKTDKYKIEKIAGDTFSGSSARLEMADGTIHVDFMIGAEKEVWDGFYLGTKERWAEALGILKSLKKKG